MTKKRLALMLSCAILSSSAVAYADEAPASEPPSQGGEIAEYRLDPILVTATRTEKSEFNIPASTEVITAEQIKESGATNALEALSKSNSITYKSFGSLGANMGTMSNDVVIRGIDNGTLILVNGSPISWKGKYNVESIPADIIERIEIVKGGSSVLYGSEAMAGVVNIITKTKAANSITVGVGNRGRQKYSVNVGTDDIAIHYTYNRLNRYDDATISDMSPYGTTKTDIRNIKNGAFGVSWNINKNLTFMYSRNNTSSIYNRDAIISGTSGAMKAGDRYNWRKCETTLDNWQLNYKDDKGWKANFFFNTNLIESRGNSYFSKEGVKYPPTDVEYFYNTREKHTQFGVDIQKSWLGKKSDFVAGINWKHENYRTLATPYTKAKKTELFDFSRNIWAVFGQWEHRYDDKNSTILGIRETFTTGAAKDQNYSNFSASAQYLHKMDKENNLYVNIAQSFIMPTFSQMYGSSWQSIPNPDLKPQRGINYEIGWKNNHKDHTWRVAIFHTDIKDNISATYNSRKFTSYKYKNEDFRNTGLEVSYAYDSGKKWSYNVGVTLQDPKVKSTDKNYWDRKFGRLQISGGVTYKYRKFRANLTGSYLAYRVQTPSSEHSFESKPYFLTTFNAIYAPTDKSEFALTIDNLLDRRDNTMHSSSSYYAAPTTFMFSFTQRF